MLLEELKLPGKIAVLSFVLFILGVVVLVIGTIIFQLLPNSWQLSLTKARGQLKTIYPIKVSEKQIFSVNSVLSSASVRNFSFVFTQLQSLIYIGVLGVSVSDRGNL